MQSLVWLLLGAFLVMTLAAAPENHRPAHRPRLGARLIPSRTPTPATVTVRPTAEVNTTAVAISTAESSTTAAPKVEARNKQVNDLSTQLLAQNHQEQIALDALKVIPAPAFNPGQFGGVIQSPTQNDLQQLLALMQAAQTYPTNNFNSQNIFGTSGTGASSNLYGQNGGYNPQNIFGQPNDPYSQYSPSQFQQQQYSPYQSNYPQTNTYSQSTLPYGQQNTYTQSASTYGQPNNYGQPVYAQTVSYPPHPSIFSQTPSPQPSTAYTQPNPYIGPAIPLPYNPPPIPTFVFKDGQYHIQGTNGQLQPIVIPTAATPAVTPSAVETVTATSAPETPTAQVESPRHDVGVHYIMTSHQTQPSTQQHVQVQSTPQQVRYVQPQEVQYTQQVQPQEVQYTQYAQQYAPQTPTVQAQTPTTSYGQVQTSPQYKAQPLVQHPPPQQVTAPPQPSPGTHSFFREHVVQSVTRHSRPTRHSRLTRHRPIYAQHG